MGRPVGDCRKGKGNSKKAAITTRVLSCCNLIDRLSPQILNCIVEENPEYNLAFFVPHPSLQLKSICSDLFVVVQMIVFYFYFFWMTFFFF